MWFHCMGTLGQATSPKNAKNEKLWRDTFQFLAELGAVPVMILADLNIVPHLSLAVRSAIDVGGWADCAALVAEAKASAPLATCCVHTSPGSRIDVVLANRISKHALCVVGLVDCAGIPTHLPVAAVFQFAEYEQTVTTIVRMKKIDLNLKDSEPEAEELAANRVVGDILTWQRTAWAMQQRNVQRLWEPWCESSEAYLHKRTKQRLSTAKAQSGRGQVRLRRATAPSAHEGVQNHRTRRLLKLARQADDLVRHFRRHAALFGGLSVVPWSMLRPWAKSGNLVKDC